MCSPESPRLASEFQGHPYEWNSKVELIDCDVSDFLRLPNTQEADWQHSTLPYLFTRSWVAEAKQSLWLDLEEDDRSLQKKVFAHTRFVPSA